MSLESGSKSEPKPKAKVEIPELPPAPTDEERVALELKEQQKKEAREKKEQEAEKRRKQQADAYTARELAGGKDPIVDGSEVVPGADVNEGENVFESKTNNTYDFDNDPEYIQFLKKEASDRDIEDIIDLRNPPKHLPDGTTFSMFIADVQKRYIQKNPGVEAQMRNVEREQIITERKTEAMKDIELAIKDELYYQDAGVDDTLNKGAQRKQKLAESYISAGLITQEEVELLEKNISYEKSIQKIADETIKDKILPELEKRGVSEVVYGLGNIDKKMAQSFVVAVEKRLNQKMTLSVSLIEEGDTFKIKVEKMMRQEVGSITRYPKTGKLSFTNSATGKQVQVGYNPKKPNVITLSEKTTLMDIDGTQVDLSAEKKNWDGVELNMNEAMNLLGVENVLFLVDSKSLAEQIGFPGIKDITYISSIVPKNPNSVEVSVPDRLYFTNPQTDKKVEVVYDPFDEVFILSEDPSMYELENGDTAVISKDGDMKNWDGIRIGLEEGKRLFKSPALHEFLVARGLEKKKEDINTNFLGLTRKDDVKAQQAERKSNFQPVLDFIGKWFDGFGV